MNPAVAPSMSGNPSVPATATPALSTDVLRAYDSYTREITEAAGYDLRLSTGIPALEGLELQG